MRDAASAATERARGRRPAGAPRPLDPEVAAQFVESLGKQRGDRLADRLADASEALDRERFDEARRLASSIASEAPDVAAAHQVFGLANYRLGRFKQAARALERADQLASDPALLPVLADCYRALRRWADVDRTWLRIRQISPAHEILAEGRIVAAGALADQGDLRGAIALLRSVKAPRRVREHHLREWYVLGDLYDRVGEPISARRTFEVIVAHDRDFADVTSRLRALGE